MAQRTGWLHHVPPLSMPRPRWHHRGHRDLDGGITATAAWLCLAVVVGALWIVEFEIWAAVWFYYGLFLGARWVWRNNVLGQTVTSLMRRWQPSVPQDPYAGFGVTPPAQGPVDLAELGQPPGDGQGPRA